MNSKIIGLTAIISFFLLTSCKKNEKVNDQRIKGVGRQDTISSVETQSLKYKLIWTAFKYPKPEKTPVKGSFNDIKLEYNKDKEINIEQALNGAKFTVNTESVNSNSQERDAKLKTFFFQKMKGNIMGSFGKFENNRVPVIFSI